MSAVQIVPPPLREEDEAWRNVLLDSLALLEAEHYDELGSDHPGARWRVLNLADQIVDRQRQLAQLDARIAGQIEAAQ